nr:biotin/lipoyl-containing protein [Massilia cavernae]
MRWCLGYTANNQDPGFLQDRASRIATRCCLKGQRGRRRRACADRAFRSFKAALENRASASDQFLGDDQVLAEKVPDPSAPPRSRYSPTHQGNASTAQKRDCSVQRRHQKVLEEAPAPGMTTKRRNEMGEAAVAAAKAVGYVGAGTVEFIANQDGSFYFMEMNTRLQVEHPVTEMITGTDLVEWQLRVAAGQPLPKSQDELAINGHSIEARIYAENPEKGFLPSIGTLRHMDTPGAVSFELGGTPGVAPAPVRIDSGVREGDAISPFYDPMIAKLIVWGADRTQALARMSQALAEFQIVGLATNIAFLKRLVEGEAFSSADLDTGLIERNSDKLFPASRAAPVGTLALAAVSLIAEETATSAASSENPSDPWGNARGWRLNSAYQRQLSFADEYSASTDTKAYRVGVTYHPAGWHLEVGGIETDMSVTSHEGPELCIQLGATSIHGTVRRDGDVFHVFTGGRQFVLNYNDPMAHAGEAEAAGGRLTAPMPGKVVAVLTEKGQQVKKGDALVIMEAMKMEHTIAAPADGLVEEILYQVGDQVADGAPLLAFKAA